MIHQTKGNKGLFEDERLIFFYPELGMAFDVGTALLLQQTQFWLRTSSHLHDGHLWVWNSYEKWAEQIGILSPWSVRMKLRELVRLGILVTGNYNKKGYDKTLWYRIDYPALVAELSQRLPMCGISTHPCVENPLLHVLKITRPIPYSPQDIPAVDSLAPQKSTTLKFGKVTIVKVSSAKAILEQVQKDKGKIPSVTPNSIASFTRLWQTLVPAHNESVKFIPSFTLAQKGQIGKTCKVWGDSSDATLSHAVKHWIALSKFIAEQNGLKTTPNAPHVGFMLKYAGDVRSFMLSSVQLTAKIGVEIHQKVSEPAKQKVAVPILEEEKPATLEQIMAWKPKK